MRKFILIIAVMIAAYLTLMIIIHYSQSLSETESAATEYAPLHPASQSIMNN